MQMSMLIIMPYSCPGILTSVARKAIAATDKDLFNSSHAG